PSPSENWIGIDFSRRPSASVLPFADSVTLPPLPIPPPSYLKSTTIVTLPFGRASFEAKVIPSTLRKLSTQVCCPSFRYRPEPPARPPCVTIIPFALLSGIFTSAVMVHDLLHIGGEAASGRPMVPG